MRTQANILKLGIMLFLVSYTFAQSISISTTVGSNNSLSILPPNGGWNFSGGSFVSDMYIIYLNNNHLDGYSVGFTSKNGGFLLSGVVEDANGDFIDGGFIDVTWTCTTPVDTNGSLLVGGVVSDSSSSNNSPLNLTKNTEGILLEIVDPDRATLGSYIICSAGLAAGERTFENFSGTYQDELTISIVNR